MRPALQRLHVSRAKRYWDALQSFVGGNREGLNDVIEKRQKRTRFRKRMPAGVCLRNPARNVGAKGLGGG